MEAKVVLIKKYENRRLYDTVNSRYVNLEEVAKLMQDGANVRVVDAATGEDITRLILTQIIVEDAKTPDSIFPVEVLRQMVLASSRATQDGALRYMQTMMDMYQRSFRMMSPGFSWPGSSPQGFGSTVGTTPASTPAAGESAMASQPTPNAYGSATTAAGSTAAASESGEIEQLRSRLAELEAAVSGLKPKPAALKGTGGRERVQS